MSLSYGATAPVTDKTAMQPGWAMEQWYIGVYTLGLQCGNGTTFVIKDMPHHETRTYLKAAESTTYILAFSHFWAAFAAFFLSLSFQTYIGWRPHKDDLVDGSSMAEALTAGWRQYRMETVIVLPKVIVLLKVIITTETYSSLSTKACSSLTIEAYPNLATEDHSSLTIKAYSYLTIEAYPSLATKAYSSLTIEAYVSLIIKAYLSLTTEAYLSLTTEAYLSLTTEAYPSLTTEDYFSLISKGYLCLTTEAYPSQLY
ncbi:hypothetical protein K440DRAFT_638850 [Wilcoxina mikolae CBS 423.85]|nr:hypothetical protein K440DRAFT_638850 [Wilcoxina mikolae CBS 423.85]